jgi:deoxyadenosine/deoxycytidine kinase
LHDSAHALALTALLLVVVVGRGPGPGRRWLAPTPLLNLSFPYGVASQSVLLRHASADTFTFYFKTLMRRNVINVISLEGLIGAGKTTQMWQLKDEYAGRTDVAFVDEPVDAWESHGLLGAMYNGTLPKSAFQLTVMCDRFSALIMAASTPGINLIITERSPWSDSLVFARSNLSGVGLDNYNYVFVKMQDTLYNLVNLKVTFVYLKLPQALARDRMEQRGRQSESGISLAYMNKLFEKQEEFFELVTSGQFAALFDHVKAPLFRGYELESSLSVAGTRLCIAAIVRRHVYVNDQ